MNKRHCSIWNPSLGAWVAIPENTRSRGKRSTGATAAVVLGCLLAVSSSSAWADGGAGGNSYGDANATPSTGGAGGTTAHPAGSVGATDGGNYPLYYLSGGGGGGSALLTGPNAGTGGGGGNGGVDVGVGQGGTGGAAGLTLTTSSVISLAASGLVGGAGTKPTQTRDLYARDTFGGGGGGGGGFGVVATAGTLAINAAVTGGSGGTGAQTLTSGLSGTTLGGAGGGGQGGGGALITGSSTQVTNTASVTGGQGGNGGGAWIAGAGSGGGGGQGIAVMVSGVLVTNSGSVTGGTGGSTGATGNAGNTGAGGVGITGGGLSVINSGAIRGGLSGDGLTRASAIQFTGGVNSLTLESTSVIQGRAVAFSAADTLALGGATNGTFDVTSAAPGAQYAGFGKFSKTGASTWTLTGTTTVLTPWTVTAGTLAISDDASLGSSAGRLTLDGGAVRALANIVSTRPVTLGTGGGTVDVNGSLFGVVGLIDGAGALTVTSSTPIAGNGNSGTLGLLGPNTFAGGTTIQNGATVTTQVSGALGSGPVLLQQHDAQLVLAGTAQAGTGGYTIGRAATADYNNRVSLTQNTSATSATFAVNGTNWRSAATTNALQFSDSATAASSTISIVGGSVYFLQNATAGNATISNGAQGLLSFGFGAPSAGSAQVTNASGGTVRFADASTASGATIVNRAGGVVDVSGMTNGGIAIGSLSGGGRVVLGASTLTLGGLNNNTTIAGVVSDGGSEFAQPGVGTGGKLTKTGAGTLTLSGLNTYTGATSVTQGTLRAGAVNALAPASSYSVASGATLDLSGNSQTVASLTNSGVVSLLGAVVGTTLRVNGAYVGNNAVLKLGTTLSATGPSDQLMLDGAGASASGKTSVQITNLGGLGASTTGNGIEVIAARNGAITTAQSTKDAFALSGGHVDAGAFEYRLYAADASGAGESWFLRTQTASVTPATPATPAAPATTAPVTTYRAEVPLFAAVPSQLRQTDLAMLGSMRTRFGDDDASARAVASLEPVAGMLTADRRAWARGVYSDIDVRQGGTVSPSTQGHVSGIQAGSDLYVSALGDWRAGLYVGTLDGSADVSGFASGVIRSVGRTDLRSRFVGGYATYANATGFYVDTVLQYGSQRYTVRPYGALETTGKGNSLTAAVEVGQAFALGGGWTWEPQAQLSARRARLDDSNIAAARVNQDDDDSWAAGVGVRIKGDFATSAGRLQPYGRVGLVYNHGGTVTTAFAGPAGFTDIATPSSYTSADLSFGGTLSLTRIVSLYGEVGQVYSAGGSTKVKSSVQAAIGVRARW